MALQKAFPTPYGVDATYWRVIQVNLDALRPAGRIVMGGYRDQEARDEGSAALTTKSFSFSGANFMAVAMQAPSQEDTVYDVIATASYTYVKGITTTAPNPDFDPELPESEENPSTVEVRGEFADALDV